VEKVIINSSLHKDPELIRIAAGLFGKQSIVASIDVKKDMWGTQWVYTENGRKNMKMEPVEFARKVEDMGAGEILLNNIDADGTYSGL